MHGVADQFELFLIFAATGAERQVDGKGNAVKKTEMHLVLLFGNQIGYFAAFFHGVFLSGMGEPFDLQALAQGFARTVHDGVIVGMADAALFADFIA